jgi:hypothetical protein
LIPPWVDRGEYPFEPHGLDVEGGRLSYVDEGEGAPIVRVHGTPTWSFIYRHLIRALTPRYRCVAPDHLRVRAERSVRVMLRHAVADRKRYTRAVEQHYLQALDRRATWIYARERLGSSAWYDGLWARRLRSRAARGTGARESAVAQSLSRAVDPRRTR